MEKDYTEAKKGICWFHSVVCIIFLIVWISAIISYYVRRNYIVRNIWICSILFLSLIETCLHSVYWGIRAEKTINNTQENNNKELVLNILNKISYFLQSIQPILQFRAFIPNPQIANDKIRSFVSFNSKFLISVCSIFVGLVILSIYLDPDTGLRKPGDIIEDPIILIYCILISVTEIFIYAYLYGDMRLYINNDNGVKHHLVQILISIFNFVELIINLGIKYTRLKKDLDICIYFSLVPLIDYIIYILISLNTIEFYKLFQRRIHAMIDP